MKQQIISQIIQYLLAQLTAADFKRVMDAMLDVLEGVDNKNQRSWHIMIRTLLNIPDND